jgi:hypothetical protein
LALKASFISDLLVTFFYVCTAGDSGFACCLRVFRLIDGLQKKLVATEQKQLHRKQMATSELIWGMGKKQQVVWGR